MSAVSAVSVPGARRPWSVSWPEYAPVDITPPELLPADPFPHGARDGVPSLLHTVKAQITPDLTIQVYLASTPDPAPSDLIPA